MSTLEWAISPEHPTESVAIETLLDEVLGPTRHRRGVYRLRVPGGHTRSLSFAAYADRYLIASIRFWPVAKIRGACLLGPLAVRPTYQDAGIGGALVWNGLAEAARNGFESVFVVGSPSYYRRFAFRPAMEEAPWIPEPVDPSKILVRNVAVPEVSLVTAAQKVWVRTSASRRLSEPRATNPKQPGR